MYCRHQIHCRVLGCFLLLFLVSGGIGGIYASLGTTVIRNVGARERSEEKLLSEAKKRRERRAKRLQRGEGAVSTKMQALRAKNLSEEFAVALQTGSLSYARLGIQAPIGKPSLEHWKNRNWRALEEQMQFGLLHGVVAYPHSPSFGGQGNIVIAGHSSAPTPEVRGSAYESVFASLPEAKRGDRIELRDQRGASHVYEVIETAVIPATETSILLQDESAQDLTLFTCYPVGTTQDRFMVRAKLVQEQPSVAAKESKEGIMP